jgi:SpoVK/Ycf46/Vps4 family AAA+-type ATPase
MDDIKGLDDVKELVKSFLFMAKNPGLLEYYHMEGGLGMLLYGAPGTGKTMFAEAVANEMKLPLFIVSPADIFKSYVGESEAAVKAIFEELDACESGAILFVDECESIFSTRKKDTKDYKAAVTTELLQRMNGFGVNGARRIMIAATNRPDEIDPAYLRFKRFSHLVHVSPPDRTARYSIIEGKLKGIALAPDVTIDKLLDLCDKYSAPRKERAADPFKLNEGDNIGDILTRLQNAENETPANPDDCKERYYSAADICGIVEEACRKALVEIEMAKGTEPIPLTMEMFEAAFKKIPPSISASVLESYSEFLSRK